MNPKEHENLGKKLFFSTGTVFILKPTLEYFQHFRYQLLKKALVSADIFQ